MGDSESALRARVEHLLAQGLETRCSERAYDSAQVNAVTARLAALPPDDLEGKLASAGFTLQPWPDPAGDDELVQGCSSCMYFEAHRRFCALPELRLPVEPTWSCILWRI
ncbi:hypothetical protein [Methylibium sp.]|uniref:hypothetical protein n=1 Tax=Methylibium sp. TaxID=2067992 RepID=UPI003D120858